MYEIVVTSTISASFEITAYTSGTMADTVMYMRTVCSNTGTQTYFDDDGGSGSLMSRIPTYSGTISLTPGTYYLIVDGYSYSTGACSYEGGFQLTVSAS